MAATKEKAKAPEKKAQTKTPIKPRLAQLVGDDKLMIVAYQTKPIAELSKFEPQFVANRTLKDPAKIEADLEAKRSQFAASAGCLPYFGRLQRVILMDCQPVDLESAVMEFEDTAEGSVAVAVSEYLQTRFDGAWANRMDGRWPNEMIQFFGFNPRTFLKIMAVECALEGKPCPGNMWYGQSDHRDISTLLLPDELPKVTTDWTIPARMLGIEMKEAPGTTPEADIAICVQVLQKFGFLQ